jgi:hypothetical protein
VDHGVDGYGIPGKRQYEKCDLIYTVGKMHKVP